MLTKCEKQDNEEQNKTMFYYIIISYIQLHCDYNDTSHWSILSHSFHIKYVKQKYNLKLERNLILNGCRQYKY